MSSNMIMVGAATAVAFAYPGIQPTAAQVRLLMQFEDTPGTYTNVALKDTAGHVTSNVGTVEIVALAGAMGNSAFYGSDRGHITVKSQGPDALGTGDFTWEARLYPLTFSENPTHSMGVFAMHNNLDNTYTSAFSILVYADGRIAVGTDWNTHITAPSGSIKFNEWNHFAVTRKGSVLTIWVNGKKLIEKTLAASSWNIVQTVNITVGNARYSGGRSNFEGYMDEVRMVRGLAVFQEEFVPANGPYIMPT